MNVVEAIDSWIDERDEELSDDDLESALDVLDAVASSEFGEIDTDLIVDEDIDDMVALFEHDDMATYAHELLRSVIYRDAGVVLDDEDDRAEDAPADEYDQAEDAPADEYAADDDPDEYDRAETNQPVGGHYDDPAPVTRMISIFSPVAPIEFRDGDELGPSFLAPSPARRRRGTRWKQYAFVAVMVAGVAAFAAGTMNLLGSLSDSEQSLATAADESDQGADQDVQQQISPPEPAVPTDDPPVIGQAPSGRVGLRLVTGDVVVATWVPGTGSPEFTVVYDASSGNLLPAVYFAWLDDSIGVADTDGNVHIIDLSSPDPTAQMIYEAGGGLGKVVQLGPFDGRIAVRTAEGEVLVISSSERADPDLVRFVWSVPDPSTDPESVATPATDAPSATPVAAATDDGAKALDLASQHGALAFTLDNGNAKLVLAGAPDDVVELWSATDDVPAYVVRSDHGSFLLGVGQGAVARFDFEQTAEPLADDVWNPTGTDAVHAIGFSGAAPLVAIVLGDGSIVLADDTATGDKIWDPAETELRALAVSALPSEIFVLLEVGTVVRVPTNQDFVVESVWDVTDETRSPANQVELETTAPTG